MYDVIIIGGGPGGSTTGSTLGKAGKKVLVLEKETFPRFHIGESLIPYGNDVLRTIGVWDKLLAANFMKKFGAEFVLGFARRRTNVLFGEYLGDDYAQTFQVERSRFDTILLEHAASLGCEIRYKAKVQKIEFLSDRVHVTYLNDGSVVEVESRWIIDASGREAVLGKKCAIPKSDLGLAKKFATFAHFHGVKRNAPPADGHITIVRVDFGWCWIIPLDDEKTSVGLVQTLEHFKSTGLKPEESFEQLMSNSPELQRRLGNATRVSEFRYEGDYTYRHLQNAGARWLMVGDAAGFVDPIFSSGVMLSIKSGYLAANMILQADAEHRPLSPADQRKYTKRVGSMCEVFVRMIKMFYDNRAFEVFMSPNPPKSMQWAVNNLVGGNTEMGLKLKFHVWMFYTLCWIQKRVRIAPKLRLESRPNPASLP